MSALDRRQFSLALAAIGMAPLGALARPGGEPAYIAARKEAAGYSVAVLSETGEVLFTEALDDRGHDAAVSPDGRTAVVFARRPGRFALVLDLAQRRKALAFAPPEDRHFYGHGFFSADGRLAYATENDFEAERGVIGVYDVAAGFRRIGELDTGAIGPHEALPMRDGRTIAVANGGITTHPDFPRQKLNLPTMQPKLTYLDAETGDILDGAALAPALHQLSLRHMAEAGDGTIWFGGQYEGPASDPVALVGTHRRGGEPRLIEAPRPLYAGMNQYIGSVAASRDGMLVATTSPRGGQVILWDAAAKRVVETRAIADACGAAPAASGFLVSDGLGRLWRDGRLLNVDQGVAWDNHLARVGER